MRSKILNENLLNSTWKVDFVPHHGRAGRLFNIYIYEVYLVSFQTFFVQAFNIVVNSWQFSMLLLYILWDDWTSFMISGSNEQLQQELEYTPIVTAGEFQNCNLDVKTL